jgi:hypothetical protein
MIETTLSGSEPGRRGWSLRWLRIGAVALLIALALYFLGGALWLNQIDDDPDFGLQSSVPHGGAKSVAVAADLIDREINTHRWVANDPWFMPGSLLDNMPNFQMGIIAALSRFGIELGDQIARTRGSSQIDPDLDTAAGLLKYPGTIWIFDPQTWFKPTASSESQYRRAMRALRNYNDRLAVNQAAFEIRADNLQATLDRIAADLGSASAALDHEVLTASGFWPDFAADDVFYANKGRLYAYFVLLRALGNDFDKVIRERDLGSAWTQMLDSFRSAALLQPWVVVNGPPDGQFLPSHLAAQGFFLLRARTQLREITNILQK